MKAILLIILAALLASCEKTIQVNLPEHEPKLVVESNTFVHEEFRFRLSKSVSTKSYRDGVDYSVKDATIILTENDVAVDTLQYDAVSSDYRSGYKAVEGKTYTAKFTAPGLPAAAAQSIVPSSVVIKDIKRIRDARISPDGIMQDEVRISFDDPAAAGNYYMVKLRPAYRPDSINMVIDCINTADPSVESFRDESLELNACISGDGIFLRDLLFNGSTKELRLYVNSYSLMPWTDGQTVEVYPVIELYHVTEDCFKHVKSSRFAADNNGNPFAEPTNVHTNLSNGYGIFTIWSRDTKEIK